MTTTASGVARDTTTVAVCAYDRLTPELGVAALVDGVQVAIFRLADGSVHAVQNLDPFSGASVMSRGITGDKAGEPTIASPIYKQVFSLLDGRCLATMDKEPAAGHEGRLTVHRVCVEDGQVRIALAEPAGP
ncbi:nitrite reductase small subunit NirD [Demequina sp. NBRC 110052]|uniref:nitrite reductase small subunit NirD n=1 Tax=Demequina sp. NBRC 110052 TaxID=1570341 RepID=UPI000A05D5B8|nr:nitrite reductase small subunit NirD [Demequina sp. NBRC 110052]